MSGTNKYLSFAEARNYVRKQNLKSAQEWKLWSKGDLKGKGKRPDFIPSQPDVIYRDSGWISWTDWREKQQETEYLPFNEARKFVRSLGLKNNKEWQRYYQGKNIDNIKPTSIPWNPQIIYKDQWKGIKDWIGTDWKNFEEARQFVRSLKLNGQIEWRMYCKGELGGHELKPYDIPSDPKKVYENLGWIDIADWVGTTNNKKKFLDKYDQKWLTYEEAKIFVKTLNLSSYDEWKAYIENRIESLPQMPNNLPKSPNTVYKDYGWTDWKDWLGYDQFFDSLNKAHVIKSEENMIENFSQSIAQSNIDYLEKKYSNDQVIMNLLQFFKSNQIIKSLIEIELAESDVYALVEKQFHIKTDPANMEDSDKALVGLIFLIYIVNTLESKINYSSLWKTIVSDIKINSKVNDFFLDKYFNSNGYPNFYLKESIGLACNIFNLRNDFEFKDEHQYLRNTILLQFGLINDNFGNLKLWLSNYNQPITISELLDVHSHNYSKDFSDSWRAIRRFRDNILSKEQTKNILSNNIWFSHLNLEELLKAAKQRFKKNLLVSEDLDLPIFYLDKVTYDDNGLSFKINAQDLYSLNLSGFRYEIYINNEYAGLIIANNSKELVLDHPIVLQNPDVNQVDLEVRNEDKDVVYSTEIMLFDFNEQMMLFDEDGNIYEDIFKKLNTNKKYNILLDSDLDCNFIKSSQREYFDGYATLIPFVGFQDDCEITYNNEFLFKLNFHEYVSKPLFIDELVLFTKTNESFVLNNEYTFQLKIMKIDEITEEVELLDFPQEAKIIKWSYAGGYVDSDEITDSTSIETNLYPEMITSPKHTLLIKYQGKAFKKVLYCNFFEKNHLYRLFQVQQNGDSKFIERNSKIMANDIQNSKYFLSDFTNNEKLYIKTKSHYYQQIKPNKLINFSCFDGFGETIFISEKLFNTSNIGIFGYLNSSKYIAIDQENKSKIKINQELPSSAKILLLNSRFSYNEFFAEDLVGFKKSIEVDKEFIAALLIQGSRIIDGTYQENILDHNMELETIKFLLLANYPFLSNERATNILRKVLLDNIIQFFELFYNDKINLNGNIYRLNFSQYKGFIEHIFMGLPIEKSESVQIIQKLMLNKKESFLLETPITLFKLLLASDSNKLVSFFYNMIENEELHDERDESFIQLIVDNLFDTTNLNGSQKHNFKIAMSYINGKYYLKTALEKLNV